MNEKIEELKSAERYYAGDEGLSGLPLRIRLEMEEAECDSLRTEVERLRSVIGPLQTERDNLRDSLALDGQAAKRYDAENAALRAKLEAAEAKAEAMERAGAEQARRADVNAEWARRDEAIEMPSIPIGQNAEGDATSCQPDDLMLPTEWPR
jgi:septal ring factor EnvC (AmiA/AmiB activator)